MKTNNVIKVILQTLQYAIGALLAIFGSNAVM